MKKKIFIFLFCSMLCITNTYAYTNSIGIEFEKISKDTFLMGSPNSEKYRLKNEKQHLVVISNDFYMAKTEITQKQWEKIMGYNNSYFKSASKNLPVESVSWNEVMLFIEKLNTAEKTNKYNLPTEAQWEYAARAMSLHSFPFGTLNLKNCSLDNNLDAIIWYCGNARYKTWEVAIKKPNNWGLYDMQGNVAEWCLDRCNWRNSWTGFIGVVNKTYKDNIVDPISKKGVS